MIIPKREYEKCDSGLFHAVLADIVDLGMVSTSYNGQAKTVPMVRFIWVLSVNGKDGKPLSVQQRFNISNWHEKANIYKTTQMILNAVPPINYDIENMVGLTRKLWIQREKSPDGLKDFANVKGILPADPGVTVPVPADFIRTKLRPVTTAGPQGQPVQTYSQPPQTYVQPPSQPNPGAVPLGFQSTGFYQPPAPPPTQQGADVKF